MTKISYLKRIDGVRIAWHQTEDIQAIRVGETCEELYVDGRLIPLTVEMHSPVQQIINYCNSGKRAQKLIRRMWAELAAE